MTILTCLEWALESHSIVSFLILFMFVIGCIAKLVRM